ncbi:MAG: hypothetical protein AB7S26_14230 [Sandaracinaceae bacterium]
MPIEMVGYAWRCFGIVIALAFIGIGATIVRSAKPTSGYMTIAVGVIGLAMTCCSTVAGLDALELGDASRAVFLGLQLLHMVEGVLMVGLVSAAAVGLANALRDPPT